MKTRDGMISRLTAGVASGFAFVASGGFLALTQSETRAMGAERSELVRFEGDHALLLAALLVTSGAGLLVVARVSARNPSSRVGVVLFSVLLALLSFAAFVAPPLLRASAPLPRY
jgi:hypothetical protein